MKKLMTVLLGALITLGAVNMFAQDAPKDDKMTSSTTKKAKKTKAPKTSKSTEAPKM